MHKHRIDVLALQETKHGTTSTETNANGYTTHFISKEGEHITIPYHSKGKGKGKGKRTSRKQEAAGVGFIINPTQNT